MVLGRIGEHALNLHKGRAVADCQLLQLLAQRLFSDGLDNRRAAVSSCWTIARSNARPARRCVLARRRPANRDANASTSRRSPPRSSPSCAASRDKLAAPRRGASSCTSSDFPSPGSQDTKTNSGAPGPTPSRAMQACQDSDANPTVHHVADRRGRSRCRRSDGRHEAGCMRSSAGPTAGAGMQPRPRDRPGPGVGIRLLPLRSGRDRFLRRAALWLRVVRWRQGRTGHAYDMGS